MIDLAKFSRLIFLVGFVLAGFVLAGPVSANDEPSNGSRSSSGAALHSELLQLLDDQPCDSGVSVDESCLEDEQFRKLVQTELNAAGCEVGPVDGIWGNRTKAWLTMIDTLWEDQGHQVLVEQGAGDDLIARITILGQQACKRQYQLKGECRGLFETWKKQPGAAAFAVNLTGSCAYSSGYDTRKEAEADTLKSCAQYGLPCRIYNSRAAKDHCSPQLSDYRNARKSKALAQGSKGCYLAHKALTRALARTQALAYCRRDKSRNCKIVASE